MSEDRHPLPVRARRTLAAGAAVAVAVAAVVAARGGGPVRAQTDPAPGGGLPQGGQPVTLDPADFTTDIDNPYLPLAPGSRWVYRATTPSGQVERIVVTVTRRLRTISGIRARVVHDVATTRTGRLIEDTRDWYAQDRAGNVWYLGEDTTAYEHGRPQTDEGSWEAGVKGAQAGIAMPAQPAVGQAYRQEWYKGVAQDDGAVMSIGERVGVPKGRYKNVVVTRDTTSLDAYDVEYKFYARGVGQVLALGVAGDPDREELISFKRGSH